MLLFDAKEIKTCVFLYKGTSTREIYEGKTRPLTDDETSAFRVSSSDGAKWIVHPSNQQGTLKPYAHEGEKPYWMRADDRVMAIARRGNSFEISVVIHPK